jgi:hypothetical protein
MNRLLLCGLALCLVVPICVGCAASPGLVRAQSPTNGSEQPAAAGAPQSQVVTAGFEGGGCPDGACGECDGEGHSCLGHCCLPKHALWYHYCPPDKDCGCCCCQDCCLNPNAGGPLVYPQNPSPGAIVQYPYYICKGPDDFFHQK